MLIAAISLKNSRHATRQPLLREIQLSTPYVISAPSRVSIPPQSIPTYTGDVMPFTPERIQRFWSHVRILGENDCWLWTHRISPSGYGIFRYGKHGRYHIFAHRMSYQLANNIELTDSHIYICHTCDNPACVNPAHLYAGDAKSNSDDMWNRGRAYRQSPDYVPPELILLEAKIIQYPNSPTTKSSKCADCILKSICLIPRWLPLSVFHM